jgi:uncharacterized protein
MQNWYVKAMILQNTIDSRTSDAVALAIRFKCPIYTYEQIMKEAGMLIDEKATETGPVSTGRTGPDFH